MAESSVTPHAKLIVNAKHVVPQLKFM